MSVSEVVSQNAEVIDTAAFAGLDGSTFSPASNSGIMFLRLAGHEDAGQGRNRPRSWPARITRCRRRRGGRRAVFFLSPPPVPGLGNGSGFTMMMQERAAPATRRCRAPTFA